MTLTLQHLIALLPLLIIGVTIIATMFGIALQRSHRCTALFCIFGLALALLSLFITGSYASQKIATLLHVDFYALFYMTLILISALATAIFAYPWLQTYPDNKEEFYLLLLTATLGGLVLSAANNLLTLFLGVELLTLPMFGLIGYAYRRKRSLEAAIKYMVLSATASSFLMFGIALLYAANGDLAFHAIGQVSQGKTLGMPIQLLGLGLMLVGFGFKLSLAPFHMWTPDVYEGAPALVSGFLATAGKIAAFCVLARLLIIAPLIPGNGAVTATLGSLAFISIILGNVLALQQNNIKRLLGYSSVAHMGYLLITVVMVQSMIIKESVDAANIFASEAIGIYLAGYMLSSIVAFGIVSLISSPYGQEDQDNLAAYKGLFWKNPFYASCLVIAMLSLAGIPITLGFIGKFYIIALGIQSGLWWLVAAVIAGSAMGLYYYLRVVVTLFHKGQGVATAPNVPNAVAPSLPCKGFLCARAAQGILFIATVLVLILGIYPMPLIQLAAAAFPLL